MKEISKNENFLERTKGQPMIKIKFSIRAKKKIWTKI
jgi:hypothetical protein